ncbi:hypothetical protein [Bifidobacterium myosotis]|uniref:Uncharacterized protein n=1 Tax=Bifidobacterium myosotis TaxID=1630166 RepID=A0A5M9ZIW5_9BIFI|nr:hypothetical protein [Bifidobacterium myosotis]KAA8827448.1 hypothetical protein EMO91_08525 [Bifidobacterium myosotis]
MSWLNRQGRSRQPAPSDEEAGSHRKSGQTGAGRRERPTRMLPLHKASKTEVDTHQRPTLA